VGAKYRELWCFSGKENGRWNVKGEFRQLNGWDAERYISAHNTIDIIGNEHKTTRYGPHSFVRGISVT